jgi:uncharacterized protein (DUF983 family)
MATTHLKRCPACQQGSVFEKCVVVRPACASCAQDFRRYELGDGAVFFVIILANTLLMSLAVAVEFAASPPLWVHALLWIPLTFLLVFGLMRITKGWLLHKAYRLEQASR